MNGQALSPPAASHQLAKGLWLGLLGIAIFSITLPATRLAVGTPELPQMSGFFIAFGRAVVAGLLSALLLVATRAPLPARGDWLPLAITAGGVVFGFPVLTSVAMRHVEAVHASVIVGVLPLATAAVGALLHRQRPSLGFWLCAALGSALAPTPQAAWPWPTCCCWGPCCAPPWAMAMVHVCRTTCSPSTSSAGRW